MNSHIFTNDELQHTVMSVARAYQEEKNKKKHS